MRILSLQPYFGGSHKAFQLGWQKHSRHDWTILTLPPRHWKWRMRHAAVHFAQQLNDEYKGSSYDALFCSDFLNLAEFKGLTHSAIRDLPTVLYFHENQFAYPSRRHDERDLHFGFTNFTSCLAADQVWFNSEYNRLSFFEELESASKQWPDFPPDRAIASIVPKCRIEPPGVEVRPPIEKTDQLNSTGTGPLRIVWAARWEHDKNPALLLQSLQTLRQKQVDFRINVIGQSFRRVPEEFDEIRRQFSDQIDRWGFQKTAAEYGEALMGSHVFISTADHEFFGIAAAESIVNGLIPVLPDRLAYPELIRARANPERVQRFLYDGTATDLAEKLEYIAGHMGIESMQLLRLNLQTELTDHLKWPTRGPLMDEQIEGICIDNCP